MAKASPALLAVIVSLSRVAGVTSSFLGSEKNTVALDEVVFKATTVGRRTTTDNPPLQPSPKGLKTIPSPRVFAPLPSKGEKQAEPPAIRLDLEPPPEIPFVPPTPPSMEIFSLPQPDPPTKKRTGLMRIFQKHHSAPRF
jgi:hypothetical protein